MNNRSSNKLNIANFIQFYFIQFLLVYTLSFTSIFYFIFDFSIYIILVSYFLILEVVIICIFLFYYGISYKNSLWLYYLVDDKNYGYNFRKGINSRNYNGFIFDKFIFPKNTQRLNNLKENKKQRLNFTINKLGFRGKEFLIKKKSNCIRIFCSGGSTTAGDSCNDNMTWPFLLQQLFKKNNFNVEVINAGVMGYYSKQELLRFKNEILNYSPDILLLHQGWNEEFESTSQNLSRDYKSGSVRNVIEANNLYIKSNSFFSQKKLLSLYLFLHYYFYNKKFIPLMSFSNPERWKCFKNKNYIDDWHQNILEFSKLSISENFLLFNIKYPSLVNLYDSSKSRKFYIENSRLTPLFAEYQAISKFRIDQSLHYFDSLVPLLDASNNFDKINKEKKLSLFDDELHLSENGNQILAKNIFNKLSNNHYFKKLNSSKKKLSNIDQKSYDNFSKKSIKMSNHDFIDRKIDTIISDLTIKNLNKKLNKEIPTNRYTTF